MPAQEFRLERFLGASASESESGSSKNATASNW
jgi:hypothetical protein